MASAITFNPSSYFLKNSDAIPWSRVRVRSLSDGDSVALSTDSPLELNGIKEKDMNVAFVNGGFASKEKRDVIVDEETGVKLRNDKRQGRDVVSNDLELLWDDGYGTKTVKDCLEGCGEMIRPNGGPPRWFCPVDCGQPLKDSPVLLFLPGMEGVGSGLALHHKALGRVFEVRCLHIPVKDRTSFLGLVKFIEQTVKLEHAAAPNKPIYLVGDSFGGCLALAVAARNPEIDLVLILSNPATSFSRSQLRPLLLVLEALPDESHIVLPYVLSCVAGNPLKMATVDVEYRLPLSRQIQQIVNNLTALLPSLAILADIITKSTLVWKLELLKSAASYVNSRLHNVKAEVLVLASGQDNLLPSEDEAKRLKRTLLNCTVRVFEENGHILLMEDGINLLSVIKASGKYRRSRKRDLIKDFLPPSMSEFKTGYDEVIGLWRFATGSAMFSTLEDGRIVRGLSGVPDEGPVLFIGYHMLMGMEIYNLVMDFLKEKKILIRGIAHPELFLGNLEGPTPKFSMLDWIRIMGAVPVTASNLFKLLSTKSHVLLYPGGRREALHYKGEAYKLIWPKEPEFVRMAAKFGATIVPFGTVGEDDVAEMVLDYHDLMKIPMVNDFIRNSNEKYTTVRDESKGEVATREVAVPALVPKIPGRFYFLFGKPIKLEGRENLLKDRESANQLYLQVKSEVKSSIDYLLKKREEDPYRNVFDRMVYSAFHSGEVPAFDV